MKTLVAIIPLLLLAGATSWAVEPEPGALQHISALGIGLDIPSGWKQSAQPDSDFHGIAVGLCRDNAMVGLCIDKSPGVFEKTFNYLAASLPQTFNKVTRESITTLGKLQGAGVHLVAYGPADAPGKVMEYTLFYPKSLPGFCIFIQLYGPQKDDDRKDLERIVASLSKGPNFQAGPQVTLQPLPPPDVKIAESARQHIVKFGIGLDLPSSGWSAWRCEDLGPDFHGIYVNCGVDESILVVVVEQLPGGSKKILDDFKSKLPANAKVTTNETITTLGPLTGTGTHFISIVPKPNADHLEYVLFFPKNKLSGYYIYTMIRGRIYSDLEYYELEGSIAHIVASMRKEP